MALNRNLRAACPMTTQDEQRIQGHDCSIIALRAAGRAMVEKSLITGDDDRQDHEKFR